MAKGKRARKTKSGYSGFKKLFLPFLLFAVLFSVFWVATNNNGKSVLGTKVQSTSGNVDGSVKLYSTNTSYTLKCLRNGYNCNFSTILDAKNNSTNYMKDPTIYTDNLYKQNIRYTNQYGGYVTGTTVFPGAAEPGQAILSGISVVMTPPTTNGVYYPTIYVTGRQCNRAPDGSLNSCTYGGAGYIRVTMTVADTVAVKGKVYIDTNRNGKLDSGESGYSHPSLSLLYNNSTTPISISGDVNGLYNYGNVNYSFYKLSLSVPSGYVATSRSTAVVNVGKETVINFGIASR